MTISDKLTKVKTALTAIPGVSVYHYWAFGVSAPYIIFEEDGLSKFEAENHCGEVAITGYAHLFTKTENDPLVDSLITALDGIGAWNLNSVQFEDETNLIHYEFEWGVL